MSIKNDLLLRTLKGETVERPPIWLMRQAGRILPEYRAIRSSLSGFVELVTTPDLAAEVTIQPVDILGVDAAIIFSDILVIPECMGLPYTLIEKKGPFFPATITSQSDIDKLISGESAAEKLTYVYDAVSITKRSLDGRVPLIGFAGAPWTLFAYMIEGQGSKTFSKAKAMLYRNPQESHALLKRITETIIAYLNLKIKAGVDVVQVFDSWAGMLNNKLYNEFCMPYINQILESVTAVPRILFSKGAYFAMDDIMQTSADMIGLDWTLDVTQIRSKYGSERILQGNLDPCVLYGNQESVEKAAISTIEAFGRNHVFNLGHGVYPDTPLSRVKDLISFVKHYRY
jgi:uroporphyrinogen decarboxylase